MKTLYININGEDVQSTDSTIVIGDERDAIIDSFYIALGEEITAGSRVRGINHKAIVTDFAKDKPEEFEAILRQWEGVKEILLSDDPTGEYTISLPPEFLRWLRYNSNPAYTEVYEKRFVGQNEAKVVLDIDSLYKDSLATIRRKVFRFWEKESESQEIEAFIINDAYANGKSKFVLELRNKLDLAFVRFKAFSSEEVEKVLITPKENVFHCKLEQAINKDQSYRFEKIFNYSCGYAIAKKANVKEGEYPYVCIDVWGNEVFSEFNFIRPFVNGYAIVEKKGDIGRAYINTKGIQITPFKYFDCIIGYHEEWDNCDFKNGFAHVSILDLGKLKHGIINDKGKEIVPCGDYDIVFIGNYILVQRECDNFEESDYEYMLYDKVGTKLCSFYNEMNIPSIFNIIDIRPDRNYLFVFSNGKYDGIMNSRGKIIYPAEYHIDYIEGGISCIRHSHRIHGNRKTAYLDSEAKKITDFIFDKDSDLKFVCDDFICVTQNQRKGLISKFGDWVLPCNYEEIGKDPKLDSLADLIPIIEKKHSKWGYVNKKGEIAITPNFHFASSFSGGLAYVVGDEGKGFIDSKGAFVLFLGYDYFNEEVFRIKSLEDKEFHNERCVISVYNERVGDYRDVVIDKNGDVIIPNGIEIEWDKFIVKVDK